MKPTPPEKEINRIEQELDESKPPGENPRVRGNDGAGGRGQPWKPGHGVVRGLTVQTASICLWMTNCDQSMMIRYSNYYKTNDMADQFMNDV